MSLSCGQEKINISAGFGLPELLNAGVRFHANQTQIGFSVGSVPVSDEKNLSISGDIFYHFAGSSEYSNRRPWYFRAGLNYLRTETTREIEKYTFLNTRFGRDFNVSEKFGIGLDVGATFELEKKEILKDNQTSSWFDLDFPVFPSLSLSVFYRI